MPRYLYLTASSTEQFSVYTTSNMAGVALHEVLNQSLGVMYWV